MLKQLKLRLPKETQMPQNKVLKVWLSQNAECPRYMTAGSAGMDLYAALTEHDHLMPGERALVPTGIYIELPPGHEGQIRPRSGLAIKHGITVINTPGTIDEDYRGEIKVALINLSDKMYVIEPGSRIAQLVIAPVTRINEIQLVEELSPTKRSTGGFGHTGD